MINLLPSDYADSIRYGRQNTKLRLWIVGLLAAIAILVLILGIGWIYLNHQSDDLKNDIAATNQKLQAQHVDKVRADAKEITGDINVIDKVLGNEVQFSSLIQTIGSYMPSGSVLAALSLSNKVDGAIDLTVNALDYPSAAQVAVNLSGSKDSLFTKVDILSITCNPASKTVYKCVSKYRVLFSQTAQKRFLGPPAGNQP